MKKLVPVWTALMLLLTACGVPKQQSPAEGEITEAVLTDSASEETSDASEAEQETAAETKSTKDAPKSTEARSDSESAAERNIQPQEDTLIYDEIGVLSKSELEHYNEYLSNLVSSRLICAAAVITDTLGGKKPDKFAEEYYHTLFGEHTSGFLLLINNDTGKDVVYREGLCAAYITDVSLALAQATPHLVEGNYAEALDILLPLGELMPEYIYDWSGVLTSEQLAPLLELAKGTKNYVLLTNSAPQPEAGETAEAAEEEAEDTETEEDPENGENPEVEENPEAEENPEEEENVESEEQPEPTENPETGNALVAYAEEYRTRLDAQTLLVLDVPNHRCVIAGAPPELLASEVQSIWETQGLMDALTHYYEGVK